MTTTHPKVLRTAAVSALLALYWLLAITSACRKGPAFDELPHLTAGYSYWQTGDFRLNPENGWLPQSWAALPLLAGGFRFPALDQPAWWTSDKWALGVEWFYGSGNDPDALLLRGRMMIALLGVGLGGLVYAWSRQLFGPAGGMISLVLFAFSPSMLAHGGLVTSDLAAALTLSASVWSLWTLLHRVAPLPFLGCAVATAAFFLSKMSAPLLIPIAALLVTIRWLRRRPLASEAGVIGASLVALALVVFTLLWAAFGFRYSAFAEAEAGRDRLAIGWSRLIDSTGVARRPIELARDHRLLPEAYLYGAAHVAGLAHRGQAAFMNGRLSETGWRTFFPYCLLVKTPLGVFAVLLLAALACFPRWRPPGGPQGLAYRTAPLWVLLAVWWAASIAVPLNIGHRHILPTYPAMFVLAGASSLWAKARRLWVARSVWLCLALLAAESLRTWPHYLAYFNALAGGPRQGYRHLVDSSLDWGQDLPGLKRWLDREGAGATPLYLSYFGTGSPGHYGIEATWLPSVLRIEGGKINHGEADPPIALGGGVYCISATMLQSVYGPVRGPWTPAKEQKYRQVSSDWVREYRLFDGLRLAKLCAFLREREPDDQVGHSILIYRLTDDDVRRALSGAP